MSAPIKPHSGPAPHAHTRPNSLTAAEAQKGAATVRRTGSTLTSLLPGAIAQADRRKTLPNNTPANTLPRPGASGNGVSAQQPYAARAKTEVVYSSDGPDIGATTGNTIDVEGKSVR